MNDLQVLFPGTTPVLIKCKGVEIMCSAKTTEFAQLNMFQNSFP